MSRVLIIPNVTIDVLASDCGISRIDGLMVPSSTPLASIQSHNLVTLTGRNAIRDLLARGVVGTGSGYAPSHIALGTSATAVSDADAALVAEAYRAAMTTRQGASQKVIYQLYLATTQGNGQTYREAGLFDSPVAGQGVMLARTTFTPVVKTSSVQMLVTWEVNIASS